VVALPPPIATACSNIMKRHETRFVSRFLPSPLSYTSTFLEVDKYAYILFSFRIPLFSHSQSHTLSFIHPIPFTYPSPSHIHPLPSYSQTAPHSNFHEKYIPPFQPLPPSLPRAISSHKSQPPYRKKGKRSGCGYNPSFHSLPRKRSMIDSTGVNPQAEKKTTKSTT
jgi:hypothetical protein